MYGTCMATKTITIDMEAYEALKRRKGSGQSFSDVIKEHFADGATGRDLKDMLSDGGLRLAPSTLDAADQLVRRRTSDPATAPEL